MEFEELKAIVGRHFEVKDSYILEGNEYEFRVNYKDNSKKEFLSLSKELSELGFESALSGSRDDAYLIVLKKRGSENKVSRLTYVFAFLTAGALIVSGILQESLYSCLGVSINPWYDAFIYVAGIVSIIFVHEMAHYFFALRRGEKTPSSFFLPGLPGITSFLPTLGSVLLQREKSVNRDTLFDTVISGPLAGILASSVFFVAGQFFSIQIPFPPSSQISGCENVPIAQVNPNILQLLLSLAFPSKVSAPGYVQISVLTDISVVGFLLSFLSLLPCSVLDGGIIARSALGQGKAFILGIFAVILLLALDSPTYWLIAIALSFTLNRGLEKGFRDELSELSSFRKIVFIISLVLAIFCVPIPQNLFYFKL
jgi:membrane-associated protease RseP (regulator of RpoE activity)